MIISRCSHWRDATETFLQDWKPLEYVEGALVTGSQVSGTATPESDIDIHIILSVGTSWRERGNRVVAGCLIEYFANPPARFPLYLKEDLENGGKAILTQLLTGEILFDKRGEVGKLVDWAQQQRDEAQLPPVSEVGLEVMKYHLWDEMDGLSALYHEASPLCETSCGQMLGGILNTYAAYLQAEIPSFSKIYKFFTDPTVAQAYQMPPFPDTVFVELFLGALHGDQDSRYLAIEKLTSYVLAKMGGFAIDGWTLRTPAL